MGKKMRTTVRFVARQAPGVAAGAIGALVYVEIRDLLRWLEEQRLEAGPGGTL